MKLFLVILVSLPGFYASLEHLSYTSYRVRRQEPVADLLEGSGDDLNTKPTHEDEEPDTPAAVEGGSDPVLPPILAEPEVPAELPKEAEAPVPAPVPHATGAGGHPEQFDKSEILVTQEPTTTPPVTEDPLSMAPAATEVPPLITMSPAIWTSDSDFLVEGEDGENGPGGTTAPGSPLNPDDMTSPDGAIEDKPLPLEGVPVVLASSNGSDPLVGGGGGGEESESNIMAAGSEGKRSSGGWRFLPVDDLSLLIFILLCLILIVILLVCCFVLHHMTAWAIIKIHPPRPSSRTYQNVCPVKSEIQNEGVAKYTIESPENEGSVELLRNSKLPPPPLTHTFSMEQKVQSQTLHRSTAEVILSGSPEMSPPVVMSTFSKNQNLLNPASRVDPPRPTSDTWLKEVLLKIENEDAEQEPREFRFNEIAYLRRGAPNDIQIVEATKSGANTNGTTTFLQKFAVNTASKKTVTTTMTTEERSVQTAQNTTIVNGDKLGGGEKSKSVDELSCEDELDDYLENVSFPV